MKRNSKSNLGKITGAALALVALTAAVTFLGFWVMDGRMSRGGTVKNPTPYPTDTPAPTPTNTPTNTPTPTNTNTPTPTNTSTPTPTNTNTPTPAPTNTPTPAVTASAQATATPKPTKSLTCTETGPGKPVAYADFGLTATEEMIDYFDNALFVGDSLMYHFGVKFWSPNAKKGITTAYVKALNLGLASYSVGATVDGSRNNQIPYEGEKKYVWEIIKMRDCPKIFMEFGANDLLYGVNNFVKNCGRLADRILETRPGTQIVYVNIPPMNHSRETATFMSSSGDYRGLNNDNIRRANEGLKALCEERGYGYIDIYSYIVDETGHLSKPYDNGDSIHENNAGYVVWNQVFLKFATDDLAQQ